MTEYEISRDASWEILRDSFNVLAGTRPGKRWLREQVDVWLKRAEMHEQQSAKLKEMVALVEAIEDDDEEEPQTKPATKPATKPKPKP